MSAENEPPSSSAPQNPPPVSKPDCPPSGPPNVPTPDPLPAPIPFSGDFGRFTTYMVIGAAAGGVASGIPGLGFCNVLCCLLNMAGVALGLFLYFKSAPANATVSNQEAAAFGAVTGFGAALISGLMSWALQGITTRVTAQIFSMIDPNIGEQILRDADSQSVVMRIVFFGISVLLFVGFGALGGVLSMQLFFKPRLRK